ncbi:outer membrane beta-barrel protein [Geomonas sp. Red32]|uniref:OmpW family outer membrane protein n=1 Tax=Geomonas sp. Red32 TaxID=2912856 RepID=UPI00202CDF5C|nr:outer membrane beta-barrel protein [Geomonas sp. Red32]MCM0080815.1 outer membrane beta-barrel protein [Geomonas sp. Red32]
MGKSARVILALALVLASAAGASADETSYFSVKGGMFLPNGKGDANGQGGLKNLDSGYSAEVAVGYRPDTYAALELGTGFYTAHGSVTTADTSTTQTIYGIPVTATAKGILDTEKLQFFAGAGVGYYFTFIDNKVEFFNGGIPTVQESSHGGALGYHVVAGGDWKLTKRFMIGADYKWFSVKPDLEVTTAQNAKVKSKWEMGGSILNVGLKYAF